MEFVPLQLPAGFSSNGSKDQQAQRWYTGSRVRWDLANVETIDGWSRALNPNCLVDQVLTTPASEKARAIHGWRTNSGDPKYVIGHNAGVKAYDDNAETVFDITPALFTPRAVGAPVPNTGYGAGCYGRGPYGTPRQFASTDREVFNWIFRQWGENLLMAERVTPSYLHEWAGDTAVLPTLLSNAPTDFDCFHVASERIVLVAGSSTEQRYYQWSDRENNDDWDNTVLSNYAGFNFVGGTGKFKEWVTYDDGDYLLISEHDVTRVRYVGPPFVFGHKVIAQDCGVLAGASVVKTPIGVVWPSGDDFMIFNGEVQRLGCALFETFKCAMYTEHAGKCVGFHNGNKSEVIWLYQSEDGTSDVDTYITWNYVLNIWYEGKLDRTIGGVPAALKGPIMIGNDGYAYEHELYGAIPATDDEDISNIYIESAALNFGDYNGSIHIGALRSDLVTSGSVSVTFYGKDDPRDTAENVFGPYTMSATAGAPQPVPVRARGQTLRIRIEAVNGPFKLGELWVGISNAARGK